MKKIALIFLLLIATVATPFLLRPGGNAEVATGPRIERLVIITPHNESIRSEFSLGFARYMRETIGRDVYIDWRQPGGTSEIAMFLKSEYANAFENLWREETGQNFSILARKSFTDNKLDPLVEAQSHPYEKLRYSVRNRVPYTVASSTVQCTAEQLLSREMFLRSNIGIGVDLFFGGGAYDFSLQAAAGTLVARDETGEYGPEALSEEHPGWFSDDIMPQMVSGEPFRDSDYRWVGTVLSAFGICYNKDSLARLGLEEPTQWNDLTDPKYFGQLALADPTKSGSATKAYEMLIQQIMQEKVSRMDSEDKAIREGWDDAMRMILKISANGRYFTSASSRVPQDVAQGEAAAGMCIDFYGRTYNERKKDKNGQSRVGFVMPKGGTSIGADPIGLLRGAPNPELAHRFIEYVLSVDGQKLWNYKPGTPGGPRRFALRRPPIRMDFYTSEHLRYMTDGEENPYEITAGFVYQGKWTGAAFTPLRFVIRCACVDTHHEQREAWEALIHAGMPGKALAEFDDVSVINYDRILGEIRSTLKSNDKIKEVALARELSGHFRAKYRKVIELCEGHDTKTKS